MFRPWKFQRLRPLERDARSRKVYIGLIHSRVVPPPVIKYSSFSSEQRELSNRLRSRVTLGLWMPTRCVKKGKRGENSLDTFCVGEVGLIGQ
jgi:hypothetical protein